MIRDIIGLIAIIAIFVLTLPFGIAALVKSDDWKLKK